MSFVLVAWLYTVLRGLGLCRLSICSEKPPKDSLLTFE
jgi:hypothetical protein